MSILGCGTAAWPGPAAGASLLWVHVAVGHTKSPRRALNPTVPEASANCVVNSCCGAPWRAGLVSSGVLATSGSTTKGLAALQSGSLPSVSARVAGMLPDRPGNNANAAIIALKVILNPILLIRVLIHATAPGSVSTGRHRAPFFIKVGARLPALFFARRAPLVPAAPTYKDLQAMTACVVRYL